MYPWILRTASPNLIAHVAIEDSSGDPITNLAHDTAGLEIYLRRELSSAWTAYKVTTDGNVEDIATLGTYSAPSANKIRFKHTGESSGIYEIQAPQAMANTADASRYLLGFVKGSGFKRVPFRIPLAAVDPQTANVPANLTQWKGSVPDDLNGARVQVRVVAYGVGLDPAASMSAAGYTSARAVYLDKLNVSGTLAHTDNADSFKADVSALATAAGQDNLAASLTLIMGAGFDTGTDSLEAIRDRGDGAWITATGFSTHSAADVWTSAERTLTAFGFTVVLADGSLTEAKFGAGAITSTVAPNLDAAVSSRLASAGYTAPDNAGISTAATQATAANTAAAAAKTASESADGKLTAPRLAKIDNSMQLGDQVHRNTDTNEQVTVNVSMDS